MSKPRFIRSSQEDIYANNNIYGFKYDTTNVPVNINKVITIYKGKHPQSFVKGTTKGTDYVIGYRLNFQLDPAGENYVVWTYVSELMRDSDYGRILELFEVKL
jgi:hypothetical protein